MTAGVPGIAKALVSSSRSTSLAPEMNAAGFYSEITQIVPLFLSPLYIGLYGLYDFCGSCRRIHCFQFSQATGISNNLAHKIWGGGWWGVAGRNVPCVSSVESQRVPITFRTAMFTRCCLCVRFLCECYLRLGPTQTETVSESIIVTVVPNLSGPYEEGHGMFLKCFCSGFMI